MQNYDPQNLDPPTLHNQYVSSAQNNWVQQYNQPDSQVWQPENVSENNYQQEENQLKFQQNGNYKIIIIINLLISLKIFCKIKSKSNHF